MKHSLPITLLLVLMFIAAQLIGLVIIDIYWPSTGGGEALPFSLEPPPVSQDAGWIFIILGVLFGTGLVLIIAKFHKMGLWRVWFLLSATLAMAVALSAFITELIALGIAILLGYMKVFKPNVLIHNITELFMYGGLAAIFIPILSVWAAAALLIVIALYDAYAVWRSKHMVALATFQTQSKIFAGFYIPKGESAPKIAKTTKKEPKKSHIPAPQKGTSFALLGGGDVAFPLLFSGAVQQAYGFSPAILLIPLSAAAALAGLLWFSRQGRFYPAMPFISAGCFIGFGLYWLASFMV